MKQKELRKFELAGHLQRMQEQDTCRRLTFHTADSNGWVHIELLLGSEIRRKKTEGNKRAFKVGGDSCRIGSMEGSGRTGQGSWQTIAQVALVVVVVAAAAAAAAAAVVEVVVVVVAITIVTNPCQACTSSLGARRLKVPNFLTISTWRWQGCQPHTPAAFTPLKIIQVLISLRGWVNTRGHRAARRSKAMKNSIHTIGNWTHDLLAVPQTTAVPCATIAIVAAVVVVVVVVI